MFVVTEADAAAIRAVYQEHGEFSAAVELRRRFPGITDNAQAREWARTIVGWKPQPLRPMKRMPRLRRVGTLLALALIFLGCSRANPGISREKAEAILKAFDYTEIELQADTNSWSGTAIPASGGYRMRVIVDRDGLMQLLPCTCGGKVLPSES